MIYHSLLQVIGRTPVIQINSLSSELGFDVFAKLESLNPGGSHKVRIALGMMLDAERRGILRRGQNQTIIEPSGGNTGIGLAIVSNLLGYRLVLVIPDNYSPEKQKLLRFYGATVVLSDSRRGNNSHGEKAMELQLQNPSYVMLNQQRNPANPQTHRETTAQEIIADFNDRPLDAFVGGIGTGGHITGIGETLKAHWADVRVFGVEPQECDLLNDKHAPHNIQGLSIGLVPKILNVSILDGMIKVTSDECAEMMRHMIRSEGISMGISSAANFVALSKLKGTLPAKSATLALIYDGVESYLPNFT